MSRAVAALSLVLVQVTALLAGGVTPVGPPSGAQTGAPQTGAPAFSTAAAPVARPIEDHLVEVKPVRVAHHVTVRRTGGGVHQAGQGTTAWERMMSAVSRIPGYRSGDAAWKITPWFGHWGVADWYGGVGYISPAVPAGFIYSVVAHEWSHLLSVRAYGGDVPSAVAAMDAYFGGPGLVGAERAADCMATLLGATWTHYTRCVDPRWRAGARRLLADRPV